MAAKILIADDSPNIRDILKMSLESSGYTVLLAENGEQALALFAREKPDLLIVDVMMPKSNGFQVCRKVKTSVATSRIPVILLTAKSQEEDVYWGKDCGADDYLTKPFSTRELERTVARLLEERQDAEPGRSGGVLAECRRRRERGEACQIVLLDWDGRAMDIYRKKYGEFKFHEVQRALRQETERFLREIKEPGPVDLHETSGLSLLVGGAAPAAMRRVQDLAGRLEALAATFYGPDDRTRGFITFRDPRKEQAPEQRFPLLSFTPRIAPDDLAASAG
jgi:DNA-binding response OmpR family regulator